MGGGTFGIPVGIMIHLSFMLTDQVKQEPHFKVSCAKTVLKIKVSQCVQDLGMVFPATPLPCFPNILKVCISNFIPFSSAALLYIYTSIYSAALGSSSHKLFHSLTAFL